MDKLEEQYWGNLKSENRDKLIDEIILQYIKQSQVKGRPDKKISFFIGGGSASGKSNFRRKLIEQDGDLLVIDSDDLKNSIPEYYELVKQHPQTAAAIVHNESSKMASKLLFKAVEEKISLIFDGTLKSPEKYKDFIRLLRKAGFKVSLVIVDVPVEIALKRNRARYAEMKEKGEVARLVPDEVVKESHGRISSSFLVLKELVDDWFIIDTRGDGDNVIAQCFEGNEQINDFELYDEFLSKHLKSS